MKITISFSQESPNELLETWNKLKAVQSNLEERSQNRYFLGIDPVKEQFYMIPQNEAFSFQPITFSSIFGA